MSHSENLSWEDYKRQAYANSPPDLSNPLSQAYASHLQQFQWDCYATVTFRNTRHDGTNAALAVWRKMQEKFDAATGFVAVEPHRLDGKHLHGLFTFVPGQSGLVAPGRVQAYCTKAFGWSTASAARSEASVSLYCAKYVTKGNDFFYFGEPEAWRTFKR